MALTAGEAGPARVPPPPGWSAGPSVKRGSKFGMSAFSVVGPAAASGTGLIVQDVMPQPQLDREKAAGRGVGQGNSATGHRRRQSTP